MMKSHYFAVESQQYQGREALETEESETDLPLVFLRGHLSGEQLPSKGWGAFSTPLQMANTP